MSKALERAAQAIRDRINKTLWGKDELPPFELPPVSVFDREDDRMALDAALNPDDKHLVDAVIYPIKRALARDWFDEDLPVEIITALRDEILKGDTNA